MIKNVVLHRIGEQPLLADLLASPRPADVSVLCTNLRTIDGKRPTAIDAQDALFIVPLATVRLIEVPAGQSANLLDGLNHHQQPTTTTGAENGHAEPRRNGRAGGRGDGQARASEGDGTPLVPIAGDLHRLAADSESSIPLDLAKPATGDPEPDEDLLRRIREI